VPRADPGWILHVDLSMRVYERTRLAEVRPCRRMLPTAWLLTHLGSVVMAPPGVASEEPGTGAR
jgi:hypothetical protein